MGSMVKKYQSNIPNQKNVIRIIVCINLWKLILSASQKSFKKLLFEFIEIDVFHYLLYFLLEYV